MSKQHLTPRLNRNEPNIVIDGGHEIWPEGTSRSVVDNASIYGSVLFRCSNGNSSVTLTNSQSSSIPSGTNIPFSNLVSKTAAGTLVATTRQRLIYNIEGYDVNNIYNRDFSLIFWVKSSVASNRSVSIHNNSNSHSLVKQYNIAAANTWELKVLTYSALNTCPGTIDRTNNIGLSIFFGIVTGTTYQTSTLNTWQSGLFHSGIGENTTWLTGTNHDFSIAGVMILPGDWSTLASNTSQYTFLRSGRNFQEELAKTQRYFEKSYNFGSDPGSASSGAVWLKPTGPTTTRVHLGNVRFLVEKRANPTTVKIYNHRGNLSENYLSVYNGDTNQLFSPNIGSSQHGLDGYMDATPTVISDTTWGCQYTADARF
jgi:hypothetical protein